MDSIIYNLRYQPCCWHVLQGAVCTCSLSDGGARGLRGPSRRIGCASLTLDGEGSNLQKFTLVVRLWLLIHSSNMGEPPTDSRHCTNHGQQALGLALGTIPCWPCCSKSLQAFNSMQTHLHASINLSSCTRTSSAQGEGTEYQQASAPDLGLRLRSLQACAMLSRQRWDVISLGLAL